MRILSGRRIALVAGAFVGLLGSMLYPASAATTAVVVFTGAATSSVGRSLPCLGPGPSFDGTKCVVIGNTVNVTVIGPLGTTVTQTVPLGGNDVAFTLSSNVCVGAGGNTFGPAVGGGACSVNVAGIWVGSCGLSIGQGTGTIAVTGVPAITVNMAFVEVGGTMVVTGWVPGSTASAVVGVVEIVPVPQIVGGPPGVLNSCVEKTATQYTIVGSLSVAGV